MDALKIENVTKIYRRGFKGVKITAVSDLSFSVKENRICGFVGPNGAGKTTTIKMTMGLVRPTRGKIFINGVSSSLPESRRGVAYVSEQPYFYRHLTVSETLDFSARLIGIQGPSIDDEKKRVLKTVELTGRENSRIRDFSKGMQQRLNMACGLLGNPKLLIFDEPMSGLDPPSRRLFRNLFRRLGEEGRTVFFSTHVLDDIEAVCDDVVVLDSGKPRYTGKVSALMERGALGTELAVPQVPDALAREFTAEGCTLTPLQDGNVLLFVPPEKKQFDFQRRLSEQNVYCVSVNKRTMPLETLLYGKAKGEVV
ncbi:MAG: ABC transporter ATP-binding protein [Chitinispirillaceae bacterium]